MNNQIMSYESLLQEKQRLAVLLQQQKAILRQDVNQIKIQMEPAYQLLNKISVFTKNPGPLNLLTAGLGLGADIFLGSKMLRKAGPLVKIGLPLAMRFLPATIFSGNGLLNKVLQLFRKKQVVPGN